jgi:hypothetical protein
MPSEPRAMTLLNVTGRLRRFLMRKGIFATVSAATIRARLETPPDAYVGAEAVFGPARAALRGE